MKYYCFFNKFGKLRDSETWVELDRGIVLRQISIKDGEVLASNRPHVDHGYFLPTGYIDYAAYNEIHKPDIAKGLLKPITKIPSAKFDSIWQKHLIKHEAEWAAIKKRHSLETILQGQVRAFYPQGVIISIEGTTTGLANYASCQESLNHTLVPDMPIQVTVGGYDERMQWLIFIKPEFPTEK
ncbi:MAG: hypothetical protein ACI9EW_003309 [Cellvibrionaceae bacterium]|jgi:hypothetical protein